MTEEVLIAYCSPTLAGMKTGSLFNYKCDSKCCIEEQIKQWNRVLNLKGVQIILLRTMKGRALIYVYRPEKLEKDMKREATKHFLREQGYQTYRTEDCIKQLASKLCTHKAFPHEIGLFLGYPLEDVKGFIEHKGKNCKCVGCWKVYFNEKEAEKTFEKYKRCTTIYRSKLIEGYSIEKLTVKCYTR